MLKPAADSHPPADHGKNGENHQRNQHDHGALMRIAVPAVSMTMSRSMALFRRFAAAVIAKESHEPEPEHIERSDEGGRHSDKPVRWICLVSTCQNFILAEESCQGWKACDRESRGRHGHESPWDVLPQPTDLAHALLAADGMNYRARREKQEPLEECVRHQVKDSGRVRRNAACHEHVTQLRDGRVSQDL